MNDPLIFSTESLSESESSNADLKPASSSGTLILPKEKVRALLHKLGSDDAFRTLYEKSPASALVELGVAVHDVMTLSADCLAPKKLAVKEVYQQANKQLDDQVAQKYGSFKVPAARLS